jgi:hypothetical protein
VNLAAPLLDYQSAISRSASEVLKCSKKAGIIPPNWLADGVRADDWSSNIFFRFSGQRPI